MRLSLEQVAEALARLPPAAKAITIDRTSDPVEKTRIANFPIEVGVTQIGESRFKQLDDNLKEASPVKFVLVLHVRVFEPYQQYVELSLTGAAIQRHRLALPISIQKLDGSKDLEGRLRTTFDLTEKGGKLLSKLLESVGNKIRMNVTPYLGKGHGRVVLKLAKPILVKRLEDFREKLKEHPIETKIAS